ncbi:MAG TPA: SMP-30/gluconolactonase/LRE family protein [Phycisphaerae bacterium]|nr:SMP-30/gluconolactonase/LRE family protein [Phycisphaerae bacterium]
MSTTIDVIADDNNLCGEAPLWNPATGKLHWTDILSSKTFQYDPATNDKQIFIEDRRVTGLALHESGGLIVANRSGLYLWDGPGRWQTVATEHEGESLAFNDILADPAGRVYAGTLYWQDGMRKTGKLYLFDTDGSIQVVAENILLANGLGLSLDGRTLYFADSAARKILAFYVDRATGRLSSQRTFVQVPEDEGLPDGLTVDAEGFVWSAQWFGGQIVRYDPEGQVERRVPIPAKQASSVTFGGPHLTDLYVTTAADYAPSPLEPPGFDRTARMGGPLYRIRLDIPGRPESVARIHP